MGRQACGPLIPVSDGLFGGGVQRGLDLFPLVTHCSRQAGWVERALGIYFPITVAQADQRGGEAEQQGQRNVCVLANLGN